ncbi:DNA helicase MCM9 isoform X3 [Leptinotarsa decemlineata]|uniref:DNA helicase MCM9 isoform X3 n=1 Tax=Leptinotarsa decemlineata TaxID=7539 RepID=UPI003D305802
MKESGAWMNAIPVGSFGTLLDDNPFSHAIGFRFVTTLCVQHFCKCVAFVDESGTVMKITTPKLLEYQRSYVCVKCKRPTLVKAEYDRKYIIKQPKKCDNPEVCSGTNLVHFGELDSENCKDYQEIKIQEQVKKLGVSSMPNTIWVTLEDDLVDSCKPGDNVTICGIVKRRWGEFDKGRKIDIDLVFKANHVQIDNSNSAISASTPEVKEMFKSFWEKYADNSLEGRDSILKSFCPQIYGLYLVKLAIAVVLAGGSHIEDMSTSTGVRTRSEPHLILVGDPGTGKSQLLRFASKIIPRSVLTTGVGSTAAGLTVTATMEHGEWQLEGGALVMADGGICCIDEFNSMKEHDRTCIHEAMEQQTISVAKASMVCKLNTRCSILAACNPKGNLDPSQPLGMNIALPSPLLSRFDLILLLRDTVNQEWDDRIAEYILNGGGNFSKLTDGGLWSLDILQTYFVTIKKLHPKLSKDAEVILGTYYQMQRRIDTRNKARTTVRLLESLVRLSQGHARLMCHESVQVVDSIYAIILVDTAMDWDSSILNLNITLNSVFPERPVEDYRNMLEIILNKLQLHQILDKEINLLKKPRSNTIQSRFFNCQNSVVPDVRKQSQNDDFNRLQNDKTFEKMSSDGDFTSGINLQESRFNNCQNPNVQTSNRPLIMSEPSKTEKEQVVETRLQDSKQEKNNKIQSSECGDIHFKNCVETTDHLKFKSTTIRKSNKTDKSRFFNSEVDEGYDTVSFDISDSKNTRQTKLKFDTRSQSKTPNQTLNHCDIFNDNYDDSTFFDILYPGEPGPSTGKKHESCIGKISISKNSIGNLGENNELSTSSEIVGLSSKHKGNESIANDGKSNSLQTIRNKMKKFKFIRKNNDSVVEHNIPKEVNGHDTITSNKIEKHENVNKEKVKSKSLINEGDPQYFPKENLIVEASQKSRDEKLFKRTTISHEGPSEKRIKNKKNVENVNIDTFQTDLEMLRHMPGVNDDFNIDLDFNWADCNHQSYSDSAYHNMTRDSSQNSKIKSIPLRFSRNSKLLKKISSDGVSSSDSCVRSESATSQSIRTIFDSSEDNLDDINFDI